jgi:hypothetical protein
MKIMIIALVVAMLFLAGCPGAGTGTQGGATGGSSQGAGTQQGGLLGGSTGASGGAGAGTSGGSTGGSTGDSNPFGTWDMQGMAALGQPVYCEVSYNQDGFVGSYKMYMKGDNVRVETTSTSEGTTTTGTTIMKGKKVYLQYSEPAEMGGVTCEWTSMDMDRIQQCMPDNTEVQGSTEMDKYDQTPAQYNCNYGTFGDEKFTVPSIPAACDLSEQMCQAYAMMNSAGAGSYTDAAAACEGLEGEALQACYQAQFGAGS